MSLTILEGRELSAANPESLTIECIESGCGALLLERDGVPPEFFDLSSGVLGALLHRLDLYGIFLAAVVPDLQSHSVAFQDFVREANRGRRFRFFPDRAEAISWLDTLQEG